MKKSIIITVLVALVSVTGAFAQKKAMDQFEVQVDGLGCPFCAYGLEKKFKELKGVKNVKIEIETGDFSFSYPSEKALTLEDVEKQVEKAGYTPITAKVTRADGSEEISAIAETVSADAALTKESVFVAGNCGMCKARIEKATKEIPGVATAIWNVDTKLLTVEFDASQTDVSGIEKKAAEVGHDTNNFKAKAGTYNDLPGCCQYERVDQ